MSAGREAKRMTKSGFSRQLAAIDWLKLEQKVNLKNFKAGCILQLAVIHR